MDRRTFAVPGLSAERKYQLDGLLMGLSDEDMLYLTHAFQRRQYEAARSSKRALAGPARQRRDEQFPDVGRELVDDDGDDENAAAQLAAAYPSSNRRNGGGSSGRKKPGDRPFTDKPHKTGAVTPGGSRVSFGEPPKIKAPHLSDGYDSDATVEHEELDDEAVDGGISEFEQQRQQRPLGLSWSFDSFFVLFGAREIAAIEDGAVRRIGKVGDDVTSLARRPTDGTIFCLIRTSLFTVDRATGKMRDFGRLLLETGSSSGGGRPVKFVRALSFSPDGRRLFCIVQAGSIPKVHGDAVCEIDIQDRKCAVRVLVATDIMDIVALEAVDKGRDPRGAEFYAWSSFKGLIAIDPHAFVSGLSPPSAVKNVSIRALVRCPGSGTLIGAGAKIYTVHMDSGQVTEETGALPYPAADFVWKPVSEDFIQGPNKTSSASGSEVGATTTPVPSSRNSGRRDGSKSSSSSSSGSSSSRNRTGSSGPGTGHHDQAPRSGRRVQFEGGGLTVETGDRAARHTPPSGGGYGSYPAPQVRGGYRSQADPGNRTPSPHDQGRRAGMGSSPRSEQSRYGHSQETRDRGRSWGGGQSSMDAILSGNEQSDINKPKKLGWTITF